MDYAIAMVLALLALIDLAIIAHLRSSRRQEMGAKRMMRSLAIAIDRETLA